MVRIVDDCVGCPKEMGCLGISCPYKNVPHYYCDECGSEDKTFYVFKAPWERHKGDNIMIFCRECLIDNITTDMVDSFFEEDNRYEQDDVKRFYLLNANKNLKGTDFSEFDIQSTIDSLTDEQYKKIREEYLKDGNLCNAYEYIADELDLGFEFIDFICEESSLW